jgi:hypothetical protein
METQIIEEVEILRTGKFTSAEGVEVEFTLADLKNIAKEYNKRISKTNVFRPVTDGHPEAGSNAPAYGWVTALMQKGRSLYATIEASKTLVEWFKEKQKRYRSIGLRNGTFDHLAVLGAAAPAVDNLADVTFSVAPFEEYQSYIFQQVSDTNEEENTFNQHQQESIMTEETPAPAPATEAPPEDATATFQAEIQRLKEENLQLSFSLNVEKYTVQLQKTNIPPGRIEATAKALATLAGGQTNFSEGSPISEILETLKAVQGIQNNNVLQTTFAQPQAVDTDVKYMKETLRRNAISVSGGVSEY